MTYYSIKRLRMMAVFTQVLFLFDNKQCGRLDAPHQNTFE